MSEKNTNMESKLPSLFSYEDKAWGVFIIWIPLQNVFSVQNVLQLKTFTPNGKHLATIGQIQVGPPSLVLFAAFASVKFLE